MQRVVGLVVVLGGVAVAKPPPGGPPGPAVADEVMIPEIARGPRPPRTIVPPPPTVAPEIAALGAQLAGKWTCNGVAHRLDGTSMPVTTSLETKLVLGNAWIASTGVATTDGNDVKFTSYVTYDGVAKQWTTVVMTSGSALAISTSLGEAHGAWTWNGTQSVAGSVLEVRQTQQLAKGSWSFASEAKVAGTWRKVSESTCSK